MMAHLIVTGPNVVYSNLNKKYPENQINHSGLKKNLQKKTASHQKIMKGKYFFKILIMSGSG